jgi:hypothetical protein
MDVELPRTELESLRVSANKRYLVTDSGTPFFWLGDTAWELTHRLTCEEIASYLDNRSQKGFNVVQTVVLAELDGLHTPNAYGDLPLQDDDPLMPNSAYFDVVDRTVEMAAERGIYLALLPTWGDKLTRDWGVGPVIFTRHNARPYTRFLAERYQQAPNILWVLGGDRPMYTDVQDYSPIWCEMAAGIRDVLGCQALISYHTWGGPGLPLAVHAQEWSDFVMYQSGHNGSDLPTWKTMSALYALFPTKPVIDSEPNYEDHPIAPWPKWNPENGYFRDHAVRKQAYRSVFAGGFGITYGHRNLWQMSDAKRPTQIKTEEALTWREALDRPGAGQMQHLKHLIESRPFLTREPAMDMIRNNPEDGHAHLAATQDVQGRYAMIYFPLNSQSIELDLSHLARNLTMWWFDPRTGQALQKVNINNPGSKIFTSPESGPDWVLVLDDPTQGFAAPGKDIID